MQTVFVDEAADILGVCRRTIYYWIRRGRLETKRTPLGTQRVVIASVETLLREMLDARVQRSARLAAERGRRLDATSL